MASPRTLVWIERLIWVLIFGGLLVMVLGIAGTHQNASGADVLVTLGAMAAAVGVFLIWVRSRLKEK
ncbi:MAG: hypothetical protein Q8K38_13785 [Burkholderiaceae bacterium]|nr:hypothetical protein [Burkholderiaceae bacterium]